MTRLLILSSNTGEGHNSAAAAVEAAAKAAGLSVRIRKPAEESTRTNRLLSDLYNTLLTYRPQWVRSYFQLLNWARPNERDSAYRRARVYIERFIEGERPDALLSVHPMLNHFIQRFIKEEGLGIPCYTFLTDPYPPFWKGWASDYVDQYFVASDEALQSLTAMSVPPWRIERVPMPVRSRFVPATTRETQDFRMTLKLDGASTILINGGARGGGPLYSIYKTVRSGAPSLNILVVCGRNSRLRRRIERLKDTRTHAFGFLEDIHRYVAASDLVITKPGAMSTFEALACGVPVALVGTRELMPQESGLFQAAARYDFGFAISHVEQLADVVAAGPREWKRKRESIAHFYRRSSGEEIVERILPAHVQT